MYPAPEVGARTRGTVHSVSGIGGGETYSSNFPLQQSRVHLSTSNNPETQFNSEPNHQNGLGVRKLPPPPSSPPPQDKSSGMSMSSSNTQAPAGTQFKDHDSSSSQIGPSDKDSSKENNKPPFGEGEKVKDNSPLTAATLEAVIAKSMTKVYSKLDSLATDLKKVQESQAATANLAGEVKQVQTEVKRMDVSVKSLHKLALDNSSRHDSLLEEVRTLQVQVRTQQTGNLHPDTEMEFLKIKALALRNNLIIEGIPELSEISEEEAKTILTLDDQVSSFFEKTLGISQVDIDSMYRLGKPRQDPTSARPILVKFQRPRDRDAVWHAKSRLNNKSNSKIRIKEDLPPKLRPLMTALYKIAQQARRYPKSYRNVMVKDFQLHVNGRAYSPSQLEDLPKKLRPSYTSTPGNIEAVAFYGRHSIFSNHYHCNFMVGETSYNSIEQFLAHRRAIIAGNSDLAHEALTSLDPVDCKRILTTLKTASSENIWLEKRHDILFSGLYAKFTQNNALMKYLLDSENRQLGEASRDLTWGVGMSLTDRNILDTKLWKGGNLLGKTLMEVRQDIFSSLYPPQPQDASSQKEPEDDQQPTPSPNSSASKPNTQNSADSIQRNPSTDSSTSKPISKNSTDKEEVK